HVRWLGVHVLAEARITAAVVGVAEKTVIGKVLHAGPNVFGRVRDRVFQIAVGRGNCESPRFGCHEDFHLRGSLSGAEASSNHTPTEETPNEDQKQNCGSDLFPHFHGRRAPSKEVMRRAWYGDKRANNGYGESSIGRPPASKPASRFPWNRLPCLQMSP